MTDALVHRGPDDFGYLQLSSSDGRFALGQEVLSAESWDLCLGNRRLSIIDLSANGRQPLANETSDVFVVHNGEIYNHVELRQLLESKGHRFRSRTDTEMIVHAYEEWGPGCVERFNGMWAFAVWDQRSRELFCSRDRFGAKPFYYHLDAELFVFASEIKAILAAMDERPRPDHAVIADYLTNGSVCHTADTFFAGIQRLEPAHNLLVSASSSRRVRYWDYTSQSHAYDQRHPVDTFRSLFDDAVRLRLRSDVPIGIALSGGLDSTAVLAEATRQRDGLPLQAFTAVFPGERFDEREHARHAASECGAELRTAQYSPDHLLEDLGRVIWHLDYPSPLAQILPRWNVMRLASGHVKVILEGQGADELLAGYVGDYVGPYLADQWARLRSGPRRDALRNFYDGWLAIYRGHGLGGYPWLMRQQLAKMMPARDDVYTRDFRELDAERAREAPAPLFSDRLTNRMHADHARAKLPMLLKFGDAISMAHSLESRLPFLDYRLVEFGFQLPVDHKFAHGQSKVVLREAMAGAMPERNRARRDKVGFITPVTRWMRQRLTPDIRPVLLSDRARARGILDPRRLERRLAELEWRESAGPQVYRWLSVELWFRAFIDGDGIRVGTPAYASPAPL